MDKNPDPADVRSFTRPLDYWLLWLAVLGLIAFNLYLVRTLLEVRNRAVTLVSTFTGEASLEVTKLQAATFDYTVQVEQDIPLNLSVPIDQSVDFPFRATIPISTVVTIPIDTPLGSFPINLPIVTTVPISLTAQVPIHLSVPVSQLVPVRMDIPIEIRIADTPLSGLLDTLQLSLQRLRAEAIGGTPAGE